MYGEDTLYLPVRELAAGIRAGRLSPVELTRSYLDRLERLGPKLGALVTLMRDQALAEARQAEAEIRAGRTRGPLHGVPYGAKDLLATKGVPTTWGAAPYRDQVFDYDATVIRKLREAGAILIAKLAMVEIAGGMGYDEPAASFTGPGRSPWNPEYWSGGSSSGSAAAVAAALVAFAIGSETSGSIMTPAAYSGVTGLRPTYGRVSLYGAMTLCWTLDKLGPMCRTADDCGLVLAAIAGADPLDPAAVSRPYETPPRPELRPPFRLGVLKGSRENPQPEVKQNFEAALEVLRRFATIEEDVTLPDLPYGAAVGTIVDAEGASAHEELIESGKVQQLTAPGSRTGAYSGMVTLAKDYLKAMRMRVQMMRDFDAIFSKYDAVLSPTRATVASPIGVKFRDAYPGASLSASAAAMIPAANLTGLPGLALPNGFGQNGLPTSIMLTGRAWEENRLIAVAAAYQRETDWHTKRPVLV